MTCARCDATRALATGRTGEAIHAYDGKGMVHAADTREQARGELVDGWDRARQAEPLLRPDGPVRPDILRALCGTQSVPHSWPALRARTSEAIERAELRAMEHTTRLQNRMLSRSKCHSVPCALQLARDIYSGIYSAVTVLSIG